MPVAIPSAARRKLVQHGVLTGAEDGIRASSFVPPHQLMAQMENNGDKFSLEISKGVSTHVPPPLFLASLPIPTHACVLMVGVPRGGISVGLCNGVRYFSSG